MILYRKAPDCHPFFHSSGSVQGLEFLRQFVRDSTPIAFFRLSNGTTRP